MVIVVEAEKQVQEDDSKMPSKVPIGWNWSLEYHPHHRRKTGQLHEEGHKHVERLRTSGLGALLPMRPHAAAALSAQHLQSTS